MIKQIFEWIGILLIFLSIILFSCVGMFNISVGAMTFIMIGCVFVALVGFVLLFNEETKNAN